MNRTLAIVFPARRRCFRGLTFGLVASGCLVAWAAEAPAPDPVRRLRAMDQDGDGQVSREEFRGPDAMFERMDSNQDGFVTPAEALAARPGNRSGDRSAARPERSRDERLNRPFPPNRPPGGGGLSPFRMDTNHDGTLSRAEWDAFFQAADTNGDERLDRREWEGAARGRPPKDPAPAVGDPAPKVRAQQRDGGGWVDLSAPNRFTVLVFGSHT